MNFKMWVRANCRRKWQHQFNGPFYFLYVNLSSSTHEGVAPKCRLKLVLRQTTPQIRNLVAALPNSEISPKIKSLGTKNAIHFQAAQNFDL